jgi:two-component system, OmpR family, alkaline phosphatase synthesis response regulator PhoP
MQNIRILVVEDEELIRTMMKINLEKAGYEVTLCQDAEQLLLVVEDQYFDLILLDIMLPGISGEEALKQLRDRNIITPVIMVTAKNSIETKVTTFETGADDYISKPFNMKELLARVKAHIRRSQGERALPSSQIMKIGPHVVDFDKLTAQTQLGEIALSEKESQLLALFNAHAGETLTRIDILEEVWGMNADPTPRTIDNFIVKFRKWFEENPEAPNHFFTVRAKGYRFLR